MSKKAIRAQSLTRKAAKAAKASEALTALQLLMRCDSLPEMIPFEAFFQTQSFPPHRKLSDSHWHTHGTENDKSIQMYNTEKCFRNFSHFFGVKIVFFLVYLVLLANILNKSPLNVLCLCCFGFSCMPTTITALLKTQFLWKSSASNLWL